MAKAAKLKLSSLAKDFNVSNKEVVGIFTAMGDDSKKAVSSISDIEASVVIDFLTKKYNGGDIGSYFDAAQPAEVTKPEDEKDDVPIPVDIPKKTAKYVDTRPTVVDLDQLDTAKAEELVPVQISDTVMSKQKLKKGRSQQKHDIKAAAVAEDDKKAKQPKIAAPKVTIKVTDPVSVGELAANMNVTPSELVKKFVQMGVMVSIGQSVDFDAASVVADDFNFILEKEIIVTDEEKLFNDMPDEPGSLVTRPPVVVVMGHVDHGKTSLLDAIREANVIATESGGITQHIGAYKVKVHDKSITFLDTPGHEAFTAMRARGAQVTDVAIIVVAADDGIMPQTIEAISHAKAAGVSIIVAINKIDKDGADPERVMQELTEHGLVPEAWGGDCICVQISAKKRLYIEALLEMVVLVSEMKELTANPDRLAKGTVIEAKLDKGRGPVATVLVQAGTLRVGDFLVVGNTMGRVRAMANDHGGKVKKAGPSTPVEIVGLSEVPEAGDLFYAVTDEKLAKNIVLKRKSKAREEYIKTDQIVTLDDLFSQIKQGEIKDLNIIVKADVAGSVEAITQSLEKIANEEVRVRVIYGGVGAITESDVSLATASNAIIVGFHVRPVAGAAESAAMHKVDMRMYRVIYEAIEEIEAAMKGMLTPKFKEQILGHAEVRQVFKVTGVGTIAGSYVLDGKISRNALVRVVRDGVVFHEGKLDSLKRFKEDARDVATGYECGIGVDKYNDIKVSDIIECYAMEEIKQ